MEKPLPLSQKRSFSLRSVLAFLLLMVLLSASQRSNAQVYYLMTSPNVQEGTKLITAGATLKTPEDVLKRVDKDGSNDADVISSVAKSPSKVALDGNNNRVFIYEALNTEKSIKIFNLTTGAALGSIDVSYEVRGMVYDPVSDYLYYITEGGDGGKLSVGDAIYRVRGDGTGNEVFLSSITINPYAIKLDIKGKRLFVYQSNWNKRMLYTYDIGTKSLTASREFANKLTYVNGVDYDETEDFFYYIVPSNTGTKIEAGDLLMRQKSDGTRDSVLMTAFLYNPINVVVNKANNRIFINDGYYANAKIISVNATNYTITDTVKKLPRSNWGAPFWALNDITAPHYAVLSSTNATAVSSASATLGGNLVYGFGLSTERGIVYSSTKALPTVADNKLSIVTNTSNAAFSSNVSGLSPSTTYYARAYAVNSAGTVYGDVVSFSTTSNNANLSSLSLSAGTLSPTFAAGTTSYTANVAYSVNSVTLTPAREQANATIEVAGTPVTSGTASAAYSLSTGENIINTIVTAQDGTKKTYTVTVTRGQTPQAITFAAFPAKTYGDGNFSAGATAGSGQAVTYASDNTAVATIDNTGSIAIKGAGTANITASQAGNANYLAATPVSRALTIAKAILTYTADTTSRNYGAANPTFTGTVSGFKNGDTQASATTGTMAFKSTANATSPLFDASLQRQRYPIYGEGLSTANYTFAQATGNDKALGLKRITVTYTFRQETHAYNGKDNPSFDGFSATFTGMANGQTSDQLIQYSYATTATAASGVGVYPIQLTNINRTVAGYNYDFVAAPSNATALTITKANLTFTAQAATKKYGEANPTFTGTITGFVNNQMVANLSGTPVYSTTATTASGVGSYPITLSGISSSNYTITAASANSTAFSINKNTLTYVADPVSRAFNNANPPLTGTLTGFKGTDNLESATTGTLTFTTTVTPSTPVGTYEITGSGLSSANYDFAQSAANNSAFSIYLSTNGNLSNVALSAGTLSPSFSAGTNNYTATVTTGTPSITVTPTLSDINAKVTVNSNEVVSGNPSVGIPLIIGTNVINVNVTSQSGTITNPYSITVTRLPSDDAEVTSITSSTGTMIPLPGYDYAYIDTVANNVTSVDISTVKHEANATLSVYINNGEVPLTSGTPFNMPLNAGSNVVNVKVIAQDGVTTKYNNVHVVRRYSANNQLKSLAVAGKSISPAFSSAQKNYTLTVDNLTSSIDVVAAIADSSAVFSVNGYGVKSGEAISQPLDVGENMMRTRVFAQSGAYTDYIITVTRAKSPDATLADIGINTPGTIDKPFNNDSLNYEYHVASTENVFRIKPVTNNNGATIRINGDAVDPNLGYSYSFLRFTVREPIVVVITSQDSSSVKMFTINAVRDFSSNAYMANLQLFGDIPLTPAFDKNIYNYTATISDSTRSSTFIIQESEDKNAEVRINYVPQTWKSYAAVPLNSGENVFSISVRAQDGTQNLYTLRVARALGATASLSGLVLSGNNGNYSNVINVYADTVYSVKAPNSVATLYVNAYANDTGAEVKINGNLFNEQTSPAVSLNLGDNRFDIEIKSADGSAIRKYTLHVNRVPFADVTLASLKVSKGIISPLFSPATSTYTVPMGSSDTTITVTPVAVDPTATITVGINTISNANPSASQHLNSGNNTVNIRVTAADGITTKLYSVRPNVPSAANANLYNILLSKGSVSPVFTAANTTYSAAVSYATSTIDIHPLSLEKAAIIKVNGNTLDSTHIAAGQNLIVGDNIFTIIVKASDVSSVIKTYTLTINRAAPSADATLAGIDVDNGVLSPVFSSSTDTYAVDVQYATTAVTLTPEASYADASVTVKGTSVTKGTGKTISLSVGENIVPIIVTAEDGSTKTYTVTITRAPASGDATLADIILSEGTVSPVFDTNTTTYTNTVPNAASSISIFPMINNYAATVTVNGITPDVTTGSVDMPLTDNTSTFTILVTAEDSIATKTYTLVVNRQPATNALLVSLVLDPNIYKTGVSGPNYRDYTATVSNEKNAVKITATTQDSGATVKINDVAIASGVQSASIPLRSGPNTINTVVTAADGTTSKTYSIVINRKPGTNALLSSLVLDPNIYKTGVAGPNYKNYAATVSNAITSIKITATTEDPDATIKVNNVPVVSGVASVPIPLGVGTTTINTVVTAADGVTTKTYSIVITRKPAANALLTSLVLDPNIYKTAVTGTNFRDYAATVANDKTSVKVTAITQDPDATVKINDIPVTSGVQSASIPLKSGANTINTVVTASDGSTTKTYSIVIYRQPGTNALLTSFVLDPNIYKKGVAGANYRDYTASVSNAINSIKVTATTQDPEATIRINDVVVLSGVASAPIALDAGRATTINTVVTASDGTNTKTYSVVITRAGISARPGPETNSIFTSEQVSKTISPEVIVSKAVSANGDGINDILEITGIESYPDNSLQIINSKGVQVTAIANYDNHSNAFNGRNNNGTLQPAGTYFYLLQYKYGNASITKSGYFILKY